METAVRQEDTPPKASRVPRRGVLAAAAWAAPTLAVATAAPAIAASPPFDPQTDLLVDALGGAEGRYATGENFTGTGDASNTDFRRAFSVTNTSTDGASFSGSLTVEFQFPGMWNQGGGDQPDAPAFNGWGTVDLGGTGGGDIGGATGWTVTVGTWSQNVNLPGTAYENMAWQDVYLRNDNASVTLTDVELPAGATVWFTLNATVPNSWIGNEGVYINPGNPNHIYWRSDVNITATTSTNVNLGTYETPVGTWADGIWFFNGGGPFAYDGGHGLYPTFGTA